MQKHLLDQAHIQESIAGEEDPGAAMEVMRALLNQRPEDSGQQEGAKINMSCSEGNERITVDVVWPHHYSKDVAQLLGMVMANHGAIADKAWSLFDATGRSSLELEVDEGADGVFYVNCRDD